MALPSQGALPNGDNEEVQCPTDEDTPIDPLPTRVGMAPMIRKHTKRDAVNQKKRTSNVQEMLREKVKREQEAKEERMSQLDGRHNFILEQVATRLDVPFDDVIEAVIYGDQIGTMNKFFQAGGISKLIFFYDTDIVEKTEYAEGAFCLMPTEGRNSVIVGKTSTKAKVLLSDGTDYPYTGCCVFFLRLNTMKAISNANVALEVLFGSLTSKRDELLGAIESLLTQAFIPAISSQNFSKAEVAVGNGNGAEDAIKQEFLARLNSFTGALLNAKASLNLSVRLKLDSAGTDLSRLKTLEDYLEICSSSEELAKLENTFSNWVLSIEQILTESQQMRKEADSIGPRAELDHWKQRLAMFDSLADQIRMPESKALIAVMVAAKSKQIKAWQRLDKNITDMTNEAKDSVRFLYTLEKFYEPLYKNTPSIMFDCLPGLVNAIRMINSHSRSYNTPRRITSLFVKITNQMVTSCREYITDNGHTSFWDLEISTAESRINECMQLNDEYQKVFHLTKKKLEDLPDEKQFDFSEMYIFGKFNNFCKRLRHILDIYVILTTYETLSLSNIEGLEQINSRFQVAANNLKKKPYDVLEYRRKEFDEDYDEFKRQIVDIQTQIQHLLDNLCAEVQSTDAILQILTRFSRLKLPDLKLKERYEHTLALYQKDLERIQDQYNADRHAPPLARDMPPIAGKIHWSRQLYRWITKPIQLLHELAHDVMRSPVGRKATVLYNKLAQVLIAYELLYYQAWVKQITVALDGLNAFILVRHPETGEIFANFDLSLLELIRETQCMQHLQLEIPDNVLVFTASGSKFKRDYNAIQMLLKESKRISHKVSPIFLPLIQPHKKLLEESFEPGFIKITWTSLNIDQFVHSVTQSLNKYERLVDETNSIYEHRVQTAFMEMAQIDFCDLNVDKHLTTQEFVAITKNLCDTASLKLENLSKKVELASQELITLLLDIDDKMTEEDILAFETQNMRMNTTTSGRRQSLLAGCVTKSMSSQSVNTPAGMPPPTTGKKQVSALQRKIDQRMEMKQLASDLTGILIQENLDSLVRVLKNNLDAFKRRISIPTLHYEDIVQNKLRQVPIFHVDVNLSIPNITLSPTLDEVQQTVNGCMQLFLQVYKGVFLWTMSRSDPIESKPSMTRSSSSVWGKKGRNYYHYMTENKDINKCISYMSTSINSMKEMISFVLTPFHHFEKVWKVDRKASMEEFLEQSPSVNEFRLEIKSYKNLSSEVADESDMLSVGPLAIYTDNIKIGLEAEAKAWILLFSKHMNEKYEKMMTKLLKKMEDWAAQLARPIKDLDDIRATMSCLKSIREDEINIDMEISPIEECYAMLQQYNLPVQREEVDLVDILRYTWNKLQTQVKESVNNLIKIQPKYKDSLQENVLLFTRDTDDYVKKYKQEGPMAEGVNPRDASSRLVVFQSEFDALWRRFQTYSDGEDLFGLNTTQYPGLQQIRRELNLLQKLYGLFNAVMDSVDGFYEVAWSDVDIDKINSEIVDYQNRCRKLPKEMKDWRAFGELKKKLEDFHEICPLLEMMSNDAMKERHWKRLEELTSHKFDVESEGFQLKNILEAPLLQFKEDIEDICISAVKEKDIEAKLAAVMAEWKTRTLNFSNFKSRGELLLKGEDTSEIITFMEDSLMVLGSLMSNRYNAPFKTQIQEWLHKLTNSTEIIEKWLIVQNLWVYLEAVFVGGDIAKQLPKEAKRFQGIDKSWVKIMTRAHEIPVVVPCCVGDETMGQLLPHLLEQLETCQKSLTGYLEKKRLIFPRFFFVSDPVLLEILGQASDSHTIQAHLLNIFDNIKTVTFHPKEYDTILEINSKEPETIPLDTKVIAQGHVELWLGKLLHMALQSVASVVRNAHISVSNPSFVLLDFLESFPAQVGILGIQMLWTRDAEIALTNCRTNKTIMVDTDQAFLDILNMLIDQTTRNLKKIERVRFETLITIHVHQRDIFNDLVKLHIRTPKDFEWLKQTRFYYSDEIDKCQVSITDVNFIYQNEFLGCTDRLVITPLTDRCYISLAQALGMSMGGSPAGPAGTGKTETVKDMGRCLGKYVVVFNCSDQMDFRGLGRIYKGLAQSGSWGCFDEFNRIKLPVLSVAAQQIAVVLLCKKERKRTFIFLDGDVVNMDPEFGLFLTMNPGYAGRQELPENLKLNFRTLAMMVPDRQIIIRVKLASCGFLENVPLSRKFFVLYKLCEEQLSKQVHYDFGLRNMLSVLRTLGQAKRANPDDSESSTVMRGLRDMNLSKLVEEDEPLFLSLVNDLFPGMSLDRDAAYPDLDEAINTNITKAGLINHPTWKLKLIQLFETQSVRHGFMVLGPTGTGKTCCIIQLMRAMTDSGEPHREMRMNPKAITAQQMFGRLDVATNDWTDGIFSTLWRRSHKAKKGEHIWLVMDGPVDTLWIENLNSVLDDNKTLTLANGDRIPMYPNCKLVFEPHNIDNASPATVSRNGMVYMSSSGLDWVPILDSWLLTRESVEASIIHELFHESFQKIYNFAITSLLAKMTLLEVIYISQAIKFLTGLIGKSDDGGSLPPKHLERIYIFSVMWSIGAILELDDRAKLQEYITKNTQLELPTLEPDTGDTIYEYFVDEKGEWDHWKTRVQEFSYPVDHKPQYATILVPNVDNVRTDFLIHTIAKQASPVLLIGEQGTAKTVMIKAYMGKSNIEEHLSKMMNFSSATTPNMFQRSMESYIDKRMGTTYGPPAGKKMTVFIDDINMPFINDWGDQITNEITRQTLEMSGFYSLEKPGDFTTIVDVQFLAAMIHPGGGRNDIPQRLKRHFTVLNCTLPSNTSIDKIFSVIGEGYFTNKRGFPKGIPDVATSLVLATRILWQLTKIKMLPTPAKFHYIFNLRDLSRIWEGMLTITSDICTSVVPLLYLWRHECTRVIADRFISYEDREWFDKTMMKVATEHIGEHVKHIEEEIFFVDFLREPPEATGDEPEDFVYEAPKIYEIIPAWPELQERLTNYMLMYNETVRGSGMDLVFFKDAMIHLMRISRIIRTDRGNALLVGVGGSGKQSLTRLASYIAEYKIFQITLTRSYNANNLLDDLKVLYRIAGLQNKGITFLFTDQEIKDDSFLEYINNLLSSGEISNLFARDELEEIRSDLVPAMKKEFPRRPPTPENLYEYFLSRARKNLHVVLCFSPVGEKFRNRSLKFPGLISGCTMDWFHRWPKDALIAVADHFISSFTVDATIEIQKQVIQAMGVFQDQVSEKCVDYFNRFRRAAHVTPKSYLSFIEGYKQVYQAQHKQLGEMASRMEMGLDKLLEAQKSVEELQIELNQKEKDLAVANVEAEKVLAEVTVSAQAAEKVKAEVQLVKDKAQEIYDDISANKAIAEEKLLEAKPALEEAERALKTIQPSHIATVRRLANPPNLIMRIMDAVSLLFKRKMDPVVLDPEKMIIKPSWGESLKLMGGIGFLGDLMNFQKDKITEETVELMAPYLRSPDFNMENAKRVCGDVAGLCSWARAMSIYFTINKEVIPLKRELAIQEVKLEKAQTKLDAAQAQLDEKEKELAVVRALYDKAMRKKQALMDDAETCKRKMKAATALISGLSSEKERWTRQCKEFQLQIIRLVGDVLLATAFLSYTGPFNQEFRLLLMDTWKKELKERCIPYTDNLNLIEMLTEPAQIGEWNLQGLPNDELSIQNAIIVTSAARYPLLIDPQGQGKIWIKNREGSELRTTSLTNKYFRQVLEDCLSQGLPLMIEDVGETLDPALDNVLEKNFIKQGTVLKVKVGDKEVDVMKGFMLYVTTKLANPSYTPEIFARTSIIDFTVTMQGLEDQLLGRVILTEKQELESERVKLLEDVTSNKRKMKELEDNLLFRLTNTKGSLVDDESLIEVLRVTKSTAEEVKQKLATAAETEIMISSARNEFRPVATRGSILYFLIVEMSMVNCMYQTSLNQFLDLFDLSMAKADRSPITSKRIQAIIDKLTMVTFIYSTRGFYEEHKFLFALLLTLKIDMNQKLIRHNEFLTLIKGGAALDLKTVAPKPSTWILDMTWLNLVELSSLPSFTEILNQVTKGDRIWKQWFDSEAPEEAVIPDGYHNSLDTFKKLLLIRSWCPDRVLFQARNFVAERMGKVYAEGVILDIERMFNESKNRTPLICFLSLGSDPSDSVRDLAKKLSFEFRAVSMGQGQEVHARRGLSQLIQSGGWMLLQNCHLCIDFLEEILDLVVDTPSVHEDFRLWITTEVNPEFSINLLQICIKFTFDPPQGIRAGLKRTYTGISQDQLDISNLSQWKPMLYALSFMHSIVQERRKFGAIGWNIPYEYNQSDFNATMQFIQNHLDDMDLKKGVSWGTVRYMIGEIQYGGRVTDDFDKFLLNVFAKRWFCEEMFKPSFEFYKKYGIQVCKTIKDYLDTIDKLASVDSPEVFGLHKNADITYQTSTAKLMLDTILNVQPKDSSSGGGETRESIVYRLAEDMLKKLPPNFLAHEVKEQMQKMGRLQPLNIFLRQEIDRMQRVLSVVRSTLTDLRLAIEGTIIMSENLREALNSMYDARIPGTWRKVSWDSSTLGFWFTELLERNTQFHSWCFEGRPKVFWMTGFFNAQGFLTAMKQEVTRAHKGWALDSVVLHNEVIKLSKDEIEEAPSEGVYVYGLYIDGAAWDKKNSRLAEQQNKVLFVHMPVLHLFAIQHSGDRDPKIYYCPVYKKPRRTDLTYITTVLLKTAVPPDHWTLRGVALLCDVK